jgi:trans-aconitate methyltransferase
MGPTRSPANRSTREGKFATGCGITGMPTARGIPRLKPWEEVEAAQDPGRSDRNSSMYDGSHPFVSEHGADVVDLFDPQADVRIPDLGCGTGHLTVRIAEPGAEVVGIDRDRWTIDAARASHPDREFRRADARAFGLEAPFDAVFSNAVLHRIGGRDAMLDSAADALRPGGRFVAVRQLAE